jgi:hypothetical protein
MQTAQPPSPVTAQTITGQLRTAITLAELLQRVESSTQSVGPAQYRRLVQHLSKLLDGLAPGPGLDALLNTFPCAVALYENARYDHAGLCRSPLEASLNSELQAREAIVKARTPSPIA